MERLKRLSEADCRKKQTGSCNGCPVDAIALVRIEQSSTDLLRVGVDHWRERCGKNALKVEKKVAKTLCPEGQTIYHHWNVDSIGPTGFGC